MESENDEKLGKKKRLEILHQLTKEEKRLDFKLFQLRQQSVNRKAIMNALHEYNDIKDATQGVLGHLADLQGVTVKKLHQKFDLPINDD